VLAQEIVDDLEAALEQFGKIATRLSVKAGNKTGIKREENSLSTLSSN
jgi:hypothetical protein